MEGISARNEHDSQKLRSSMGELEMILLGRFLKYWTGSSKDTRAVSLHEPSIDGARILHQGYSAAEFVPDVRPDGICGRVYPPVVIGEIFLPFAIVYGVEYLGWQDTISGAVVPLFRQINLRQLAAAFQNAGQESRSVVAPIAPPLPI